MASRVTWPVMALWVPRQDVSLGTTRQTNVRTRLRIANGCAGSLSAFQSHEPLSQSVLNIKTSRLPAFASNRLLYRDGIPTVVIADDMRECCYLSLVCFAPRDSRKVLKRCIFRMTASWRACSCFSASAISPSRRLSRGEQGTERVRVRRYQSNVVLLVKETLRDGVGTSKKRTQPLKVSWCLSGNIIWDCLDFAA